MPSCWRRPWTPLWSNDHSPPRRNPNTCVWTKGMTILQAVGLPPDTAIGSTSGTHRRGEAGRLWRQAVSGAPVGCGTDAGMALPSAVRSWSGTTRRQRTTSVCYSSACALLLVPATVASGHFEIVTKSSAPSTSILITSGAKLCSVQKSSSAICDLGLSTYLSVLLFIRFVRPLRALPATTCSVKRHRILLHVADHQLVWADVGDGVVGYVPSEDSGSYPVLARRRTPVPLGARARLTGREYSPTCAPTSMKRALPAHASMHPWQSHYCGGSRSLPSPERQSPAIAGRHRAHRC